MRGIGESLERGCGLRKIEGGGGGGGRQGLGEKIRGKKMLVFGCNQVEATAAIVPWSLVLNSGESIREERLGWIVIAASQVTYRVPNQVMVGSFG